MARKGPPSRSRHQLTMTLSHDPGGRRVFPLQIGVRGGASLSECGQYRVLLWRQWGDDDRPSSALWIGTNPSTATGDLDDPTIRREVDFTRRIGLQRYVKTNVMDYRATSPRRLTRTSTCLCSSVNLATIRREAASAAIIILAYGKLERALSHYADRVVDALRGDHRELWAVGLNKDGSPRHPLYVRADAPLIRV
jgi:hypothetical protein